MDSDIDWDIAYGPTDIQTDPTKIHQLGMVRTGYYMCVRISVRGGTG